MIPTSILIPNGVLLFGFNIDNQLPLVMIPPVPLLHDYGLSPECGFLPETLPLQVLPHPYYTKWEAIATNLQALLLSRRLREVVNRLPILSTSKLHQPAEWRRAYMLLAFVTHAYIWGGDKPEEVSKAYLIRRVY